MRAGTALTRTTVLTFSCSGALRLEQQAGEGLSLVCPLCGSDGYVAIHVRRPGGNWYRTPFYRCFGCSVMFEHPRAFAQQRKIVRDPEVLGGAHKRYPPTAEEEK